MDSTRINARCILRRSSTKIKRLCIEATKAGHHDRGHYVKKYIFTLFMSCSLSGISSKSFLKFDPIQASVFIDPTNLVCKSRFFIELLPFYIQNTNKSEISEYFLPFNCNLLTSEDNATNVSSRDIAAIHLNINHVDN